MDGPNWEQLLRNGQLIQTVPEHRVMLERFLAFYEGTNDEQLISQKYPEFYTEMKPVKSPKKTVKVELKEDEEKPAKKSRKSSPSTDAK
jgi:hypothetical protein